MIPVTSIPVRKGVLLMFIGTGILVALLGFGPFDVPFDKALHFIVFFIMTTLFYWVLDVSRKRAIQFTFVSCILLGGVGSEFVQSFSPYRNFDAHDIPYNVAGSSLSLVLSAWYHRRMLDRKRYQRLHNTSTEPINTVITSQTEELPETGIPLEPAPNSNN
ncbi:hypothetical protein CANCADRAFT_83561 [Tortispora caseinolytica NRRL Y-17796]|uniref:VanZ-like domain-containing protein n=1 Tax=Tortispora caseinolytica NRRL Y-17796 TaxID=767744 RepID=A0A1E4TKA0_9ASCO|nr:hypothetical protein CANCADRAFT_83561 [Tortispora caseinolytica NRRL Y-17796]